MGRRTYDVFVSYRSIDKTVASDLARRLAKAHLKVWLDRRKLRGGESFDDEIDAALAKSRSVAVLVGPGGVGPWQKREIARAAENPRTRLIPVLLPKVRPGCRLPLALAGLHRIDLTRGSDKDNTHALVAAIDGKPDRGAKSEPPPEPPKPLSAKPRRKVGSIFVRGNGNQIATKRGVVTGNIIGSVVVTGGGNNVRTGRFRGQ
jgi:hypothetical protein